METLPKDLIQMDKFHYKDLNQLIYDQFTHAVSSCTVALNLVIGVFCFLDYCDRLFSSSEKYS